MSGVNKVIILGRIGQDPEIRFMPNGNAVANISVATSEKWKDKQTGQQQESTEWHRVVVFGKLAEICGEYLRKGSEVYFEGKLKTRKWTDQQGVEKYTTEIVVDMGGQMQMLGGGNNQSQQSNNQQQGGYSAPQQQQRPQQSNAQHGGGYGQQQAPQHQNNNFAPRPKQSNNQGGQYLEPPIDFDDD